MMTPRRRLLALCAGAPIIVIACALTLLAKVLGIGIIWIVPQTVEWQTRGYSPPSADTTWYLPSPPLPVNAIIDSYTDIVVRGRLAEIDHWVVAVDSDRYTRDFSHYLLNPIKATGDHVYVPGLSYTFRVDEYLKGGDGSPFVVGLVSLPGAEANSALKARMAIPYFRRQRDTQYDHREIIVLLRKCPESGYFPSSNIYCFGQISSYFADGLHSWPSPPTRLDRLKFVESYNWMPARVQRQGIASRANDEPQYFSTDPFVSDISYSLTELREFAKE